jgi:hypothetical protein
LLKKPNQRSAPISAPASFGTASRYCQTRKAYANDAARKMSFAIEVPTRTSNGESPTNSPPKRAPTSE